jgi:hypothetical protein
VPRNQWNAWTPEEDDCLRVLFEAGNSKVLVAAKMKRTISAIKARAFILKISVKRKKFGLKVKGK